MQGLVASLPLKEHRYSKTLQECRFKPEVRQVPFGLPETKIRKHFKPRIPNTPKANPEDFAEVFGKFDGYFVESVSQAEPGSGKSSVRGSSVSVPAAAEIRSAHSRPPHLNVESLSSSSSSCARVSQSTPPPHATPVAAEITIAILLPQTN